MKIIYQNYWEARRRIQAEEVTVSYLDTCNKTKYLKKFKKGEVTLEEISKKNHENGLMYNVTVLNDLDKPINSIDIVHENEFIGVQFLDDTGREYLAYHFEEIEPMKKLFLGELWYRKYSNDETDEMDYYIHFVFDREGNASYRKYDEINKKTIDYESNQPFDVSGLYEDYPKFGEYENLIKEERDIEIVNKFIK